MAADDLGAVIGGKYRLIAVLGSGAMGVVYRAEQLDAEGEVLREVALKMMQPELSRDPSFARRFLREVRIAAGLRSPYIVPVYDTGQSKGGRLYFTMELVRGPTIADLLRKLGKLPVERVVAIGCQICDALAEAHSAAEPIVHRDLKPGNVFVEQRGGRDWVKVADFGIAKVIGEGATAITASGVPLGTPRYMAPEQWRGVAIDGRADLYALGIMMYEMCSGQTPFSGGPEVLMYKHLNEALPPLPPSIPAAIRDEIARSLSKDPAGRPRDASTFKQALERGLAGSAVPTGGSRRRRSNVVIVAGGLVLAVGAGFAAWRLIAPTAGVEPQVSSQPTRRPVRAQPTAEPTQALVRPPATLALSPRAAPTAVAPVAEARPTVESTPLAECDQRPASQQEVEQWVEEYRAALERKDVAKLAALGEAPTPAESEALSSKLEPLRDYQVRVENLSVELQGTGAEVAFDVAERWKDPHNPSFVLDFNRETRTLRRQSCRLLSVSRR